jgi:ribulose-5-phosphate 4-epimerase/fuculose-1-phosphate aldolase
MSYKKHIVDTMKRLYNNKYISIRDGNISFKPKNENFFYISASSVKKNILNEDQVIKVNFKKKGVILKDEFRYKIEYNQYHKYEPSREIIMHSYLQTDPLYFDKNIFVVHAHPPNILSYISLNKGYELDNIKNLFPELNIDKIGKNVKYYETGSDKLAINCYKNLKNNNIIGLEKHGSLSMSDNIDEIFENIETLEYYINIYLNSKK